MVGTSGLIENVRDVCYDNSAEFKTSNLLHLRWLLLLFYYDLAELGRSNTHIYKNNKELHFGAADMGESSSSCCVAARMVGYTRRFSFHL